MKVCRFNDGQIGIVRGDRVYDVTRAVTSARNTNESTTTDPVLLALTSLQKMPARDIEACESFSVASLRLLAPISAPGKIIGAPVNYRAHIREMTAAGLLSGTDPPTIGEAGLFLKATSSLVGPSQGIRIRFPERRTDHEVELVVIIGRMASEVTPDHALEHVAGYCIGLDITLRGREERSFRKSIDSYSVIGPWLTTADEIPDPQDLRLVLRSNGVIRQDASTSDMVYGVAQLIAYASTFYTLHPGDILFTGTPPGVSAISHGDELEADCTQLGAMKVTVSGHEY
jgi:2-keto-4-pentenoate hydratase/2-oxohepta-3-ene-1,7-dioic acid hydratase in catechol pathway